MQTRGKAKERTRTRVKPKAMIQRVMANNGQIIPKERVMAMIKAVVMAAKAISQTFSAGIVVVITKLQIVGRAIMCVKFVMDKIHPIQRMFNVRLLVALLILSFHRPGAPRQLCMRLSHRVRTPSFDTSRQ